VEAEPAVGGDVKRFRQPADGKPLFAGANEYAEGAETRFVGEGAKGGGGCV